MTDNLERAAIIVDNERGDPLNGQAQRNDRHIGQTADELLGRLDAQMVLNGRGAHEESIHVRNVGQTEADPELALIDVVLTGQAAAQKDNTITPLARCGQHAITQGQRKRRFKL